MDNAYTLILVVDDQSMNLKLADRIISKSYSVRCADSGEACLGLLQSICPDLILLDIHMPNMSGFEVMDRINQNPKWKTIPVIFLSSDSDTDAEIKGFELGAMDFIKKPFVAAIMMKRIEKVLELSRLQKKLIQEVDKQTARSRRREESVLRKCQCTWLTAWQ